MRKNTDSGRLSRRDFIRTAAGAAAFGAVAGRSAKNLWAAEDSVTVNGLPGVVFGRMGYKVTRIAFGGILVTEPPVLMRAIDSGINLIHTSAGYQNGNSIKCFGEVMKSRRDDVVFILKGMPDENLDNSLRTLGTDYVEMVIPSIDDMTILRSAELRDTFMAAREAGKCGHLGFACHTQKAEFLDAAIELGYIDVILMSYADTSNPEFMASLVRAREAGIAILAMKGLPKRARGPEALEKKDLYASRCSTMVMRDHAHAVLASMGSHQVVDMYREILESRLGWVSPSLERRHWADQRGSYCGMCGKCRGLCPNGVEVADIVRFRMYERDYRMSEYARAEYAGLGESCNGANCEQCGLCESVCTRQLPLRSMIAEAHASLA